MFLLLQKMGKTYKFCIMSMAKNMIRTTIISLTRIILPGVDIAQQLYSCTSVMWQKVVKQCSRQQRLEILFKFS